MKISKFTTLMSTKQKYNNGCGKGPGGLWIYQIIFNNIIYTKWIHNYYMVLGIFLLYYSNKLLIQHSTKLNSNKSAFERTINLLKYLKKKKNYLYLLIKNRNPTLNKLSE